MEKPKNVRIAIQLLTINLVASAISTVSQWPYMISRAPQMNPNLLILSVVFGLVFNAFIIVMLSRRMNWARLLYTAMLGIGLVPAAIEVSRSISERPFPVAVSLLLSLIQIYVVYLLFTPESSQWFKRRDSI